MTNDPHQEVHDLAQQPGETHDPVDVTDHDADEALAKINKALTKRINDLRTDFDTTRKAISNSVKATQDDLDTVKTRVANNKDTIEAQDALVVEAKGAARSASTQAVAAKSSADEAASKADRAAGDVASLSSRVGDLNDHYTHHTHNLTVNLSGATTPPIPGEAE